MRNHRQMTEQDRKELFPGGLKPVYWALLVYVVLVPLAYLVAIEAPGRKDWPFWAYAAVTHAILCAVVAATGKVVVSVSEQRAPNSRLRPYAGHIRNFIAVLAVWPLCIAIVMVIRPATGSMSGRKSVTDRVSEFGETVHRRLGARFSQVGVAYPPRQIILVGLKQERTLEVWAPGGTGEFRQVLTYPILGASGTLGPKLREGDNQVPEGLYKIESLNPNSKFHLALRLNYPSSFDKAKGKLDGRRNLGGDIMIHGGSASVGCLAMGNEAAEDLFLLAAQAGIENVSVILSPVDFRVKDLPADSSTAPSWTAELYTEIKTGLRELSGSAVAPPNAAAPR
jgi:hypothetical protein